MFPGSLNDKIVSIGSSNGSVPNKRQTIIWTNDGLVHRRTLGIIRPQFGEWCGVFVALLEHSSFNHSTFTVQSNYPFTSTPRQNGRRFAGDIFKWVLLNENIWLSIKISLKFVPMGLINNIPALVPIMAWCRPGGKPLSEPIMVRLRIYSSLGLDELIIRRHLIYPT